MSKKEQEHSNVPDVVKSTAVYINTAPDDIDIAADMAEFGANYAQAEMSMPFLQILQAMSPQVTRGQEQYIKEAQAGMFFNTVTKELYDGEAGINIIFGSFKASYIEWVPRSQGGGFVNEYSDVDGARGLVAVDPDNNRVIQPGSPIGTPGNHLSLTHTRMAFVVSDDLTSGTPAIVSMTASQLGVSAQFNTRHKLLEFRNPQTGAMQKGPPLPLVMWKATTKLSQNEKGSWFSWNLEKKGFLHEMEGGAVWSLYREVRDFTKSSKGQQALANAAAEMAKTINATTGEVDDDIPF